MKEFLNEIATILLIASIGINGWFLKGYAKSIKDLLDIVKVIELWKAKMETEHATLMDDYEWRRDNERHLSQGSRDNS